MARRLPVYLVLDVSGSMTGEPIEAVKNGVQVLVSQLMNDPQAIETTYLSVITFESTANQIVPLTAITDFQMPNIQATGLTAMGEALELVCQCIDNDVSKTTAETKGDWKPIVIIMTDGAPTDDFDKGMRTFNQNRKKMGMVIPAAAGMGAEKTTLLQLSEQIIELDTDAESISTFFKWVTASIVSASKSVNESGKDVIDLNDLPPPPAELNIVT